MKYLIVILLLICPILSKAQVLDKCILVNNRDVVKGDYVFHDGDSLSFKVNNIDNENSLCWDVCVEMNEYLNGNLYDALMKQCVIGENFGFSITPQLFSSSSSFNGSYSKRIEHENDSLVYTHAVVHLYKGSVVLDSMSLYLNVLPSRPKIIRAELKGEFDYEYNWYQQSAKLCVEFSSYLMKGCCLQRFVSDSIFANVCPMYDWASKLVLPMDYLKNYCAFSVKNGVFSFKYNDADWGEFYKIYSYNDYGDVDSKDAINTTKLINDTNVISSLKKYFDRYTRVNNVKSDNILSISYKNDRICVNNNIRNIPIMIYSFDGRLVFSSMVLDSIDVPALPKGLYYVKAISNTGFFQTCKIIIK